MAEQVKVRSFQRTGHPRREKRQDRKKQEGQIDKMINRQPLTHITQSECAEIVYLWFEELKKKINHISIKTFGPITEGYDGMTRNAAIQGTNTLHPLFWSRDNRQPSMSPTGGGYADILDHALRLPALKDLSGHELFSQGPDAYSHTRDGRIRKSRESHQTIPGVGFHLEGRERGWSVTSTCSVTSPR